MEEPSRFAMLEGGGGYVWGNGVGERINSFNLNLIILRSCQRVCENQQDKFCVWVEDSHYTLYI